MDQVSNAHSFFVFLFHAVIFHALLFHALAPWPPPGARAHGILPVALARASDQSLQLARGKNLRSPHAAPRIVESWRKEKKKSSTSVLNLRLRPGCRHRRMRGRVRIDEIWRCRSQEFVSWRNFASRAGMRLSTQRAGSPRRGHLP